MKFRVWKEALAFTIIIVVMACLFACGGDNVESGQSDGQNQKLEFTIIFDGDGGKLIYGKEAQIVKSADEIAEPVYEKTGYDFDGWDKTIASIDADATIKAKWKEKKENGTDISIPGFTRDGTTLKCKVNNDITSYSFINRVNVSADSTWQLFSDISGTAEVITKTINLEEGDNTYYILVTSKKGDLNIYTIVVRRMPIYTVVFNTNGGTEVGNKLIQEGDVLEQIDETTRYGYDFSSWDYDFALPIMSNLVVNAEWVGHNHVVNLNVNGGSNLSETTIQVKFGENFVLPTPSREGYRFIGWANNGTSFNSGIWQIDDDIELMANWKGNTYSITYNLNGGAIYRNGTSYIVSSTVERVVYGSDYALLDVIKTGYDFVGWFFDNLKIESGVWSIPNNINLNATWVASKYKIYYDTNGGEQLNSDIQEVSYDSDYELTIPNRPGHVFLGWYNNNVKFESGKWSLTNDVSLIAEWEPITYSVSLSNPSSATHYYVNFDRNDGTGVYLTCEASVDSPIEIPETPTNGQKVFRGWFTDIECVNPFDFSSKISSTITLYAGWYDGPSGANLQLNSQYQSIAIKGGYKSGYHYAYVYIPKNARYIFKIAEYSSTSKCRIDVDIKSIFTNSVNKTTRIGYFGDYRSEEKSFEIDGIAGDLIEVRFYETLYDKNYSGNAGLYNFTIKVKAICEEFHGSELLLDKCANTIPINITYGTNFDLGTINYKGYSFYGWFTEPNGCGVQLTDLTGKSITPWLFVDVSQVYAYLIADSFTISYDSAGGSMSETTQNVLYDDEYTLINPSKDGHTFLGWYHNDVEIKSGVWHYDKNLDLTAKWEVNTYKVTLSEISSAIRYYLKLDKNDGTDVYSSAEVSRDGLISYPTPFTRTGYIFTGWFSDKSCTKEFDFTQSINQNLILYAGWKKNPYANNSYNLVLNGRSYTVKYTNGGESTGFYFTAFSTGTYSLNYSCTASAYLSFYDVDDGKTSHSYASTLNGSGEYALSVIKGKTYYLSFGTTQSSYQTGTTCTVSITGTYPQVYTTIGDNPNLTLSFVYGSSYFLGIPDSKTGKSFVGWFTGENGTGTQLTDSTGNSINNWEFMESINAFAYFE